MNKKPRSRSSFKRMMQKLNLSEKPGVYQMLDQEGKVLYIGKAVNLKKRILSYSNVTNIRILQMIRAVRDVKVTEAKTEAEALLLEAILVKKRQPFYNVLLKDDKSFPHVALTDHKFPRITTDRSRQLNDEWKDKYMMCSGPFLKASALNRVIKAIQKAFLVRSCTDAEFSSRKRPCILYEIKRCSAPCVNKIDEKSYGKLVKQVERVFQWGEGDKIIQTLEQDVLRASKENAHELAKLYRDRLRAVKQILVEQKNLDKIVEREAKR